MKAISALPAFDQDGRGCTYEPLGQIYQDFHGSLSPKVIVPIQ
jgi:hypothetical protein